MTPLPTHGRWARFARRTLPWGLAALFAALALFTVAGRVLTANLEGAEARVGALLSAATGFEVRVGHVEGRFLGWHPVLEAEAVDLAPPGAAPAVRIGRMRLELDIVESLARAHLVAETLVVEDVHIDLMPGVEAGWRLRGGRGGAMPDPEPIVSFLYHSDYVDLRRAELRFWPRDADGEDLADRIELDGTLLNERFDHRGHLSVRLHPATMERSEREAMDAAGATGGAVGEGVLFLDLEGDPLDARTRAGEVLVDLERVPLSTLTGRLLAAEPLASGVLDRLRVRLRLDPEEGVDLSARASALRLDAGATDPVPVRNARIRIEGAGIGTGAGDLRLRELRSVVGDESLDLDGTHVAWRGDAGARRWFVRLPAFEASSTVRLLLTLDFLGARANRWIANLDPSAEVLGARIHVDAARSLVAGAVSVRDLRLRGYGGVPTLRGADATAVFFEGGGWIDLDSGPFYLRFPAVFAEGWRYRSGRGRIHFRFGEDALHLLSGPLEIVGAVGRARGRFGLYLPPERADRRMTLMLGIDGADAAFTEAYLPERFSAPLRGWLVDAVRAGRVPEGAVVIQSNMAREEPRQQTTAIWFDIREGRLDFDPDWPVASSLAAHLVAEPEGVRARIDGARIGGIEIGAGTLEVAGSGEGERILDLEARGRSDGEALLDFLRRAPLGDAVEFLDAGWTAAGPVDLDFALTLPLGGGAPSRVEVGADFDFSSLHVPQGRLTLEELGGHLDYRYPGRLDVSAAEGRLFGGPVAFSVSGDFSGAPSPGAPGASPAAASDAGAVAPRGGTEVGAAPVPSGIEVRFSGEAAGPAVARWLDIDALSRLGGRLEHSGVLRIAPDGGLDLRLDGMGEGLSTGLPAPLGAPQAPLVVQLDGPAGEALTVDLDWGPVAGRFLIDGGALERGALGLEEAVPELPQAGMRIRGTARRAEVGAWLTAVARMEDDALVRGRAAGSPTLLDVSVDVADGRWGTTLFGATRLDLGGSTRALEVDFDAERIAGNVRIESGDVPVGLTLTRLELPLASTLDGTPEDADNAQDAGDAGDESPGEDAADTGARGSVVARLTRDLDTASMPDVDVRIEAFSYRGEDLGRASFELRPDPDGLRLEAIDAVGRGLRFGADDQGRARADLRLVPTSRTRVVGRLSGEDAVSVQKRWGLAPTLESDEFAFGVDVAWDGPLDLPDPERLEGTVVVDVERGRFVQIDAGTAPLRVVGLVNFAAIARRLRLDFTDVYKRGIAFEDIEGLLAFENGMLVTREPIRIAGPSSSFLIEGDLDLATEVLDGAMIVTLPVSSNLPWYAAYAALLANPIAGAGVFVAERIFREQIDKYSSARYRLGGTLDAPEITFDTIFENDVTPNDGDPNPAAPADASGEDVAAPEARDTDQPAAPAAESTPDRRTP